jgi:hypothetical protein
VAFNMVVKLGRLGDDAVRRVFHQFGLGLVWRERPIGYQPSLLDEPADTEPKRGRGRPKGSTDSYKRPPRRKRTNGAGDEALDFGGS